MQSGMCKDRAVVLYSTEKCPVLVLKVSSKQKYHKGARSQEGTRTCKQCFLLNLRSVPQPWGTGNTEETARDNPHVSPVKVPCKQVVGDVLELPGRGEGGQSKRQKWGTAWPTGGSKEMFKGPVERTEWKGQEMRWLEPRKEFQLHTVENGEQEQVFWQE